MGTKRIEEIDKNFVSAKIGDRELVFLDIHNKPFEISGLGWFDEERQYCRLPVKRLPETNEGVQFLAWNMAGAMVRFRSNSRSLAIRYELRSTDDMSHIPRTAISGFDLFQGVGKSKTYLRTAIPVAGIANVEALLLENGNGQMTEWTLNFPLYNGVKLVQIGVDPDSQIDSPTPFMVQKPILFYGSSITQGGCASRPGNAYTHIVSRWLDASMLNFGFSGSARAEPVMAELMCSRQMSVFVYDYDHNAPTAAYLRETHEAFYKMIRKYRPELPIVMVAKPNFDKNNPECCERRDIVRRTYDNAIASGDKRVYHVENETLFGSKDRDACTVDGCHPNDLGFMRMAEAIYPAVRKALIESGQISR
jgi:hypothetical protein